MNAPVRPDELTLEERLAPMFAGPAGAGWADIAAAVSQKWMARSLTKIRAALAQAGEADLAELLARDLPPRSSAWRPEFAMAERAAAQGQYALAVMQVAMACDPGADGLHLSATCPREACLYLDGWLFPVEGACKLAIQSHQINLTSARGRHVFRFEQTGWAPETGASPPGWECERLSCTAPRTLIRAVLPSSQGVFPWPDQRVMLNIVRGRDVGTAHAPGSAEIRAALERLARSAPGYRDWVAGAIDTMVVLHGEPSSSADFPGLVVLGQQTSSLDACESLVMLAAPQYFSRLASIIEIVQPGAEEIHYVPERRSYVTTRHLLAHAHEKANLIAMLGALASSCAEARRRWALRRMQFAVEFQQLLRDARSLTPAGAAFWSRLQQLAQAGRGDAAST